MRRSSCALHVQGADRNRNGKKGRRAINWIEFCIGRKNFHALVRKNSADRSRPAPSMMTQLPPASRMTAFGQSCHCAALNSLGSMLAICSASRRSSGTRIFCAPCSRSIVCNMVFARAGLHRAEPCSMDRNANHDLTRCPPRFRKRSRGFHFSRHVRKSARRPVSLAQLSLAGSVPKSRTSASAITFLTLWASARGHRRSNAKTLSPRAKQACTFRGGKHRVTSFIDHYKCSLFQWDTLNHGNGCREKPENWGQAEEAVRALTF